MVAERRKPPDRKTITQILDAMQGVADVEYEGDLQNNALKIFNTLPVESKRTFLRKAVRLFWESQIDLAQQEMVDLSKTVVLDESTLIDPRAVAHERRALEASQGYEARRFVDTLTKYASAAVGSVIALTVVMMLFVNTNSYVVGGSDIGRRVLGIMKAIFSII